MMKCAICSKEIVLVPSATERAKKFGETAAYYTKLFTTHSRCFINRRSTESAALMRSKK